MKILNVIPYWGEWFGGPFINTCNFCAHAMMKGHRTLILTTTQSRQAGLESFPWTIGNRKIELPIEYFKTYDSIWRVPPNYIRTFGHVAAEFDFVFLHGLWQFPIHYAASYCKKHSIPYIINTHAMLSKWSLSNKPIRKRIFLSLSAFANLSHARLIFYMREDEKEALERYARYAKKAVFTNALNREDILDIKSRRDLFKHGSRFDSDNILFLSRIHPKKGLINLLKALLMVLKDRPSANLVIAGAIEDKKYYSAVRDFIASHQISGSVRFAGPVCENDKKSLFLKTDILVLPTMDDAKPVVLIEAMGAGIPVVTTEAADIPEIHETMGYITSGIPEELAKAMSILLGNKSLARNMGSAGHRYVLENFIWEKNIDLIIDKCANAIKNG